MPLIVRNIQIKGILYAYSFQILQEANEMEVKNTSHQEGNLQISVAVVEKVAKLAALESEGVKSVSVGSTGVKGLFAKTNLPKPVDVTMYDGVAEITVNVIVAYGAKIPVVCRDIQKSVKFSVQNMTNITVSKVNVVVCGVEAAQPEEV